MENEAAMNNVLDLGTWVGRKQAFSLVAGKCSAADAECLRKMKECKGYVTLGMTWDQFCREHLGVSRQTAERVIRYLDEFGPAYFELTALLRIAPEDYREIAACIDRNGVSCGGEVIPFKAQDTRRLAEAVDKLLETSRSRRPEPRPANDCDAWLYRARKAFQQTVNCYARAWKTAGVAGRRVEIAEELSARRATLARLPEA